MERDFMGLSSKEPLAIVKEEVNNDAFKEIGFVKGSAVQWPFSNKVSAVPHLMSFNMVQGDQTKKITADSLLSSGFMPISAADAYESNRRHSANEIQKPFIHDRPSGAQFSLTPHSVQHDVHSMRSPYEMMFPVSNQAIATPLNNPLFNNHFSASSQNLVSSVVKPQLLGGVPVTTHSMLPTIESIGGHIESWKSSKPPGSPAQLTIFYAGAVHVYDDIPPEKAQTIMFLAGNGSTVASNVTPHKVVQAPVSKTVAGDNLPAKQPVNAPVSSGLSSPMFVSSHTGVQSVCGSTSNDEVITAKTKGTATAPVGKVEPPKMVNATGSVVATSMIPSVPQARKASLARFLEKRKERVMNIAPYYLDKKPLDCATPESSAMSCVATSAADKA